MNMLSDLEEINEEYTEALHTLRGTVEFSGKPLGEWEDILDEYYPVLPEDLDLLTSSDFYAFYKQLEDGSEIIENNLFAATSLYGIIDAQMQQSYREKYLSFTDKLTIAHKELAARHFVSNLEHKKILAEIIKNFWFEKKSLFISKRKQIESIFWLSKNDKDRNLELEK